MSSGKRMLDELIQEAKAEHGPDVDWDKVEAKLFPRVEREARAQAALGAYGGSKRIWAATAVLIAAAASVPLFFPRGAATSFDQAGAVGARSAGTLLEKDRAAVVHASGAGGSRDLAKGGAIAQGDVIDVRLGHAVFKRVEPSGVTWSLEDGSQVDVRATRGTLILALARGAVEAQVAPVAAGEAFAIDVEGARVAVHGTHLRVERQGTHAIVDLREGVVSIGTPPKSGATYGDLVTAPAHVEFDPADPHGTLKVSHDAIRVRAAQTLEAPTLAESMLPSRLPVGALPGPFVSAAPKPPMPPAAAPLPPPAPAAAPPAPASPVPPQAIPTPAVAAAAAVSQPVPAPPAPAQADPNPERSIVEKVRQCAGKHVEHSDAVVITVRSHLELRIGDSGMVTAAIFNPPLAPEVQACASSAIFGTRFAQPGAVSIPIDVTP